MNAAVLQPCRFCRVVPLVEVWDLPGDKTNNFARRRVFYSRHNCAGTHSASREAAAAEWNAAQACPDHDPPTVEAARLP